MILALYPLGSVFINLWSLELWEALLADSPGDKIYHYWREQALLRS